MNNQDYVDKTPKARIKRVLSAITRSAVALAISFLMFYIFLPPINVFSRSFWIYVFAVLVTFSVCFGLVNVKALFKSPKKGKKSNGILSMFNKSLTSRIALACIALPLVVILIGTVISSVVFNSRKYATVCLPL